MNETMMDGMKLLWGDLHNHCGISYGFGGLENALLRAAAHLDFCAVTGHAMWPDMYDRNKDTAFIVDFHNQGFEKLRKHWEETRGAIAAANGQDLVTFQSYEMHSSRYGDHHLLAADDALPLIYRDSPEELVRDSRCDAITVAHHIGYTPGYRGINWDEYDSTITPLIEVCSKHGCAMREEAPYPYYHDMGPRDGRNTVFEGLKRGHRFGFLGSTDHHAGYPGSYGDGKAAVWAEGKSREAIWRALKERRCYAVTADRIECRFAVNGFPLGSVAEGGGNRRISFKVTGAYPLDKMTIYKNLFPLHIINGETLPGKPGKGRYKLRIEMGWGNNIDEDFLWEGKLKIDGGRLQEVEPCFRGKSILSPTNRTAGEEVNGMDNRIVTETEDCLEWQCYSVRNISTQHPQTQAVIPCVEGGKDTALRITINGMTDTHTLGELARYGYSRHVKPWHSQAFKVHPAFFETAYTAEAGFTDPAGRDGDFY
ncbi:MAG: DUF3604 domain-containing protein, partial [Treponema sp.]|nr:DUF3604 domain-containing protein [Treponema sp.]